MKRESAILPGQYNKYVTYIDYFEEEMTNAVVLLSGGQDSTTCLLIAREEYEEVYPVTFNYDQRHKVEIDQARYICRRLNVPAPVVLHVRALKQLGGGALTNDSIRVNSNASGTGNVYAAERGLPSTVIPGRNVVFLALAAAYGADLGCYNLITGGCLADREGYPDCRAEFYESMETTLQLALEEPRLRIITPLIDKTKAQTFAIAERLDGLQVILESSHTCYQGDRKTKHDWGFGCGKCPACLTRKQGWEEYQLSASMP